MRSGLRTVVLPRFQVSKVWGLVTHEEVFLNPVGAVSGFVFMGPEGVSVLRREDLDAGLVTLQQRAQFIPRRNSVRRIGDHKDAVRELVK